MASRKKKALITGITGQDGSYLAELLLEKGYEVHGLVRRASTTNRHNIDHIFKDRRARHTFLHYGDMTDHHSLVSIIAKVKPDEIYNLAAQSHVRVSFDIPLYTAQADAVGVLGLLEAVRTVCPSARVYQASTSEMYSGAPEEAPQSEQTPFHPRSPYGVAKLYAASIARTYREGYGMYVVNGILFNHESPRRSENFVTRKVIQSAILIKLGLMERLSLGNLEAERDWGYAPEYVEAMWRMLQQKEPEDFVIATGQTHSVRFLAEESFRQVGIAIIWKGKGINERGIDAKTGKVVIEIDPVYFRPNEVDYLCGDASKARRKLGWKAKTTFPKLVKIMADAEKARYNEQLGLIEGNHTSNRKNAKVA